MRVSRHETAIREALVKAENAMECKQKAITILLEEEKSLGAQVALLQGILKAAEKGGEGDE